MSRCFPYPPPGYTLSGARNEALIESIKLQKEKERKKEKKERKREKKERRKERKERRKERKERKEKKDKTNPNLESSDIVKDHIEQTICSDTKGEFIYKRKEAETDQLERSNVTEEHARPVSSSSSESTETSNKRKRHSSPVDDTHGHGKVILIRLPSKKQNEFDALLANEHQPCSVSGRSDSRVEIRDVNRPEIFVEGPTNGIDQGFTVRNNMDQICSTSGQIEGKTGIKSMPSAEVLTPMQRKELEYKNLIENLFPPPVQDACIYSDDLDWLFQGRRNQDNQEIRGEKKRRFESDGFSCSRSLGLCARAEYLPEVDVYALPYVVPY